MTTNAPAPSSTTQPAAEQLLMALLDMEVRTQAFNGLREAMGLDSTQVSPVGRYQVLGAENSPTGPFAELSGSQASRPSAMTLRNMTSDGSYIAGGVVIHRNGADDAAFSATVDAVTSMQRGVAALVGGLLADDKMGLFHPAVSGNETAAQLMLATHVPQLLTNYQQQLATARLDGKDTDAIGMTFEPAGSGNGASSSGPLVERAEATRQAVSALTENLPSLGLDLHPEEPKPRSTRPTAAPQ